MPAGHASPRAASALATDEPKDEGEAGLVEKLCNHNIALVEEMNGGVHQQGDCSGRDGIRNRNLNTVGVGGDR